MVVVPYDRDVEDLDFEKPDVFFGEYNDDKGDDQESKEKFEMDFKFIYMHKMQGASKIELSKVLSQCNDIHVFNQDLIQRIIDFKWDTYAKNSFIIKFLVFVLFCVLYYFDLESIPDGNGEIREKGAFFWISKSVCCLI